MKRNALLFRCLGIAGTIVCILTYIVDPSWPTTDKLLVFTAFVFMIFGQAVEALKRLVPFVAFILVYESLRGLATINTHVHYTMMAQADRIFGNQLPTIYLQHWLWKGHVMWYDFMFYGAYMLHFILPMVLAIAVWKLRASKHYWRVAGTYIFVSYAAFVTFLLYPAAPPWMASQNGYIPHVTRVSSQVFQAMGINDFPSVYNKIVPNTVAAVPSLHAAFATLLVIFSFKYFGKKWGLLSCLYPLLIWVGTVYMGEHYLFDEVLGVAYAFGGYKFTYWFADRVWPRLRLRAWLQQKKAAWQDRRVTT